MLTVVNGLVDGSLSRAATFVSDFSPMLKVGFGLAIASAVIGIFVSFSRG